MSAISSLQHYLQVARPFVLQPYGGFGMGQIISDPKVIADINASAFAGNCTNISNPDYIALPDGPTLQGGTSYANDTDAATGGVPVGGIYRNGNFIMVRMS
jgi:hypothetical protein